MDKIAINVKHIWKDEEYTNTITIDGGVDYGRVKTLFDCLIEAKLSFDVIPVTDKT
jgi:hypothetical protein